MKPIYQKNKKIFFFQEIVTILFLKKIFEENFFFQILRGQKSKIGCFYEFIPGFPKRLGRMVFVHWKWGYYSMVCKICGSAKSVIFEISKKISQLWCPGNQCGQLSRSLKIWAGIVPYNGYHWYKFKGGPNCEF